MIPLNESVLLEPWYDLRLELPAADVGRALSDIQRMGGEAEPPELVGEEAVITAAGPVSAFRDYAADVAAYTRGRGRLSCVTGRYRPCADQESVVKEMGYDPERDVENPASSVFCSHGAGHEVPWNEVEKHMHLPAWQGDKSQEDKQGGGVLSHALSQPRHSYTGASIERDKELMGIFEKTYGAVKPRAFHPPPPVPPSPAAAGQSTGSTAPRPPDTAPVLLRSHRNMPVHSRLLRCRSDTPYFVPALCLFPPAPHLCYMHYMRQSTASARPPAYDIPVLR